MGWNDRALPWNNQTSPHANVKKTEVSLSFSQLGCAVEGRHKPGCIINGNVVLCVSS